MGLTECNNSLLQSFHPTQHQKYLEQDKDALKSAGPSVYSSAIVVPKKPIASKNRDLYAANDPRQLKFEKNLMNFIFLDSAPFSITENLGFNLMIEGLDPRLTIPSRRTVGRKLNAQYEQARSQAKTYLPFAKGHKFTILIFYFLFSKVFLELQRTLRGLEDKSIHLIIDMWTSKQNLAVIGITAQYICDWKIVKSVIGFKQFDKSHTGVNIKTVLDSYILETLKLRLSQVNIVQSVPSRRE